MKVKAAAGPSGTRVWDLPDGYLFVLRVEDPAGICGSETTKTFVKHLKSLCGGKAALLVLPQDANLSVFDGSPVEPGPRWEWP